MAITGPPIFILGMERRVGTNYLSDLLALHPDCVTRSPLNEDHLLQRSALLWSYVDAVSESWEASWQVPASERAALAEALGHGLMRFVAADAGGKRVVTKTPSVAGLGRFFELLPEAHLLVLVRDGRDQVESFVRSFAWSYESAMRRWARAARVVLDFDAAHRGRPGYRLVRYEGLSADPEAELGAVFSACGLDEGSYDWSAARRLPVRGSSELTAGGGVHWQPVPKPVGFAPEGRWRHWDEHRHRRFNALAGAEMTALGYELVPARGASWADAARTAADTARWAATGAGRRARRLIRQRIR